MPVDEYLPLEGLRHRNKRKKPLIKRKSTHKEHSNAPLFEAYIRATGNRLNRDQHGPRQSFSDTLRHEYEKAKKRQSIREREWPN